MVTFIIFCPKNTWSNAEAEAVALGGHLATIRNAAEDRWVYSKFGAYGGALWIMTGRAASRVFQCDPSRHRQLSVRPLDHASPCFGAKRKSSLTKRLHTSRHRTPKAAGVSSSCRLKRRRLSDATQMICASATRLIATSTTNTSRSVICRWMGLIETSCIVSDSA